jgi:hypothetical protein
VLNGEEVLKVQFGIGAVCCWIYSFAGIRFFWNVKYSRGSPHCKVLFKISEAQQLNEYQQ